MRVKKNARTNWATAVLFDRFYKGRPRRIAELKRTRQELALGRKIRELRESRGLSQARLARALGTQAPAISRIEDAEWHVFKLRWREKHAANVPLITRPRLWLRCEAIPTPASSPTTNGETI